MRSISGKIAPSPQSAYDLLIAESRTNIIPSGVLFVDSTNGLISGTITEFCGFPGVGKTQMSLSIAAHSLATFEDSSIIYIDTELKFNANRLLDICITKYKLSSISSQACLRRVIMKRPTTCKEMKYEIDNIEDMLGNKNIKLV
jgi:RecA/RadA recombinase